MSEKSGTNSLSSGLPEGTVTFLFTDIEGSTRLWQEHPGEMPVALEQHNGLLQAAIEKHKGYIFQIVGDAFCAAFESASEALSASLEIQHSFKVAHWDKTGPIHVRTGLHTGPVKLKVGDYTSGEYVSGLTMSQTSRLVSAGHGGQILLSNATAQLVRDYLPEGVILKDMGAHRLRDLDRADTIYQVIAINLPSEFPLLKTLDARPNNLPVQPTPFVGREDELAALETLITDPRNRLVSIVGAGGMGKSRLAIETAERQLSAMISSNGKDEPRFPDGAFFVRLAPLESTEALIPTMAEAFGFHFNPEVDPKHQILDFFRQKRLLLVMDNFEHMLEGAQLLAEVLETAPEVRVLVTSRAKLDLRGEVIYPLFGMRFPEEGEVDLENDDAPFSAVELFLQSARRIHPNFTPNSEEMFSIGRICRLVEGMPLGVELAATWMEMLSPEEIAREVEASLDFLEAERRDAPERHHSIRAVFDYTWKLLSEGEQEVLSRISVFRGGFSIEAAREVTGASLKQLQRLVNKSLLQRNREGRFDIHMLLRQYAAEKLDREEEVSVRNRHCVYYAEFLARRKKEIRVGRQTEALKEIDNIRAFYIWAATHEKYDAITKSSEGFFWIFMIQGWFSEAIYILEQAFQSYRTDIASVDNDLYYALIMGGLGFFQCFTGDRDRGLQNILKGQSIIQEKGNKEQIALANLRFIAAGGSQNSAEQIKLMEENLAICKEIDDPWMANNTFSFLAGILVGIKEWENAESLYLKAIKFSREAKDFRLISRAYQGLGYLEYQRGNYSKAKKHYGESLFYARKIGYRMIVGDILLTLSEIALTQESYEEAKEYLQESLGFAKYSGTLAREAETIHTLGIVMHEMGELDKAEGDYQESLSIYRKINYQEGVGLVTCDLGNVSLAKGEYQGALKNYFTALEMALELEGGSGDWLITWCLSSLAHFHWRVGDEAKAVELATLVHGQSAIHPYMKSKMTKLLAELQDEFAEAQERGRERELGDSAREMLGLLEGGDLEDMILTSEDQG